MANERRWFSVAQYFLENGKLNGKIVVNDATGFYVKSKVKITSNTQPDLFVEVKRIENDNIIYVGPAGDINLRSDLSLYLKADNAKITLYEQFIPTIKQDDIFQSIYDREPIVAIRTINVDKYGRHIGNDNSPVIIKPKDTFTDAFSRMRVSDSKVVFDWQFRYSIAFSTYWDTSNINGATQTLNTTQSTYYLNGTTTIGCKAILQTRRYIEYIPGRSKQVFITANFNGANSSWIKRYGTFDNNNGLFFELNGTTLNVVVRSSTSGTPIDTKIPQSLWNGDRLDGTGPSGYTLDLTKQQLLFIDYAYLGSGDIRFGFYINGEFIIAHTFTYSNIINFNYMQSGTLPIRASLDAIGTPTSTTNMQISSVSVVIEGIDSQTGKVKTTNNLTTNKTFTIAESFIFGMRINPAYPYSSLKNVIFQVLEASGNVQVLWRVYLNPTLTGPIWTSVPNSIAQTVSNTPTFSVANATLLASGYFDLRNTNTINLDFISDVYLGRNIALTPDILIITMQGRGGNGSVLFATQWKEFL